VRASVHASISCCAACGTRADFPALSESVSAINKIANSETESIDKLSNSILKDFALTNKLLRLVNSAYFRPAGGGSISTVSRAVVRAWL
jgi:HD-like signal output (HDOD) protein